MYYLIAGIPVAAVFAIAQLYLCEKSEKTMIKLLPVFFGAALLIAAEFIRGENLLASAVYGIFGRGIFALVLLLWISGAGAGVGFAIGWIIYLIKQKTSD